MKKTIKFLTLLLFCGTTLFAQTKEIPKSYSNIKADGEGSIYFDSQGSRFYTTEGKPDYTYASLFGNPKGTESGIDLDFGDFDGSITYGLIPYGKAPHPLPVFRFTKELQDGKVSIDIARNFRYPYDFVDWQEKEQLVMGYRLITKEGTIIYDGELAVTGKGSFEAAPALYEGPFVNKLGSTSVTIWYNTTMPVASAVQVNGKKYKTEIGTYHEIEITGLQPNTKYPYKLSYGSFSQEYHFNTAPEPGSRKPFVFAYTSDSRHATGGGERYVYGANTYIIKKMAALAYANDAAFVQFTGDMINGYLDNAEETHIQYTNWKKAVEPFWHYIPFNLGMGNHEALSQVFRDSASTAGVLWTNFRLIPNLPRQYLPKPLSTQSVP